MPLILPLRKIDKLLKNNAIVTLKNNEKYIGYGDCLVYLPIDDDTDEEDEFLRFVTNDKRLKNNEDLYLTDDDIKAFKIIS